MLILGLRILVHSSINFGGINVHCTPSDSKWRAERNNNENTMKHSEVYSKIFGTDQWDDEKKNDWWTDLTTSDRWECVVNCENEMCNRPASI